MPAGIDLPFTRTEYATRLSRVRVAMERSGIDTLICVDPSNMAWLTGYDGWSFYVHQAVIVGPSGDPVFWGRKMDAMGALRTCYIDDGNIVAYPDHFVMSTERHPMDHLAQVLRDRAWLTGRIGVEMENYYYSARAHHVLTKALDGAQLADATALVNWERAVKSPAEIAFMRRAAHIAERMHETAFDLIAPGRRKNEVVAEIQRTAILGGHDSDGPFGGDYAAIVPLVPTGKDATAAHLTWNDKPFSSGEGTFFELAGCYRRYHAPLCRTVFLGDPPRDMRRAETALLEGISDGIDKARSGNTAGDVARAFNMALKRHGIERDGRAGYPIGLSYPPDWGERTFSIRPEDQTVLEPDMTVHFMPGLWMDDWGLEITETLRILAEGPAECLCDVPRKLFVKP